MIPISPIYSIHLLLPSAVFKSSREMIASAAVENPCGEDAEPYCMTRCTREGKGVDGGEVRKV